MALSVIAGDYLNNFRFSGKAFFAGVDTGATNTRLGVFEITGGKLSQAPSYTARIKTDSENKYHDLLNKLLIQIPDRDREKIVAVAAGIPGPFDRATGNITNSNGKNLKEINVYETLTFLESLGIKVFAYLNDLEATTWGLTDNGIGRIEADLNPAASSRTSTEKFAVLAQGTGLGQGFAEISKDGINVLPTEGGHTDLPIFMDDSKTIQLREYLENERGRTAEAEDVLSGFGILETYLFVSGKAKLPDFLAGDDAPAAIFRRALEGHSDCQETMRLFVKIYGAQARNFALATLADTVFLAGNAYSQRELLTKDDIFIKAFLERARFKTQILEKVRVGVVNADGLGERGGVNYLRNLFETKLKH